MTNGPATPLLLVGPVTNDIIGGRRMPGGAVSYGAMVAAAFGLRARIMTIAGPDADLSALDGHDVHVIEDPYTMRFEIDQGPAGRVMRVPGQPTRPLTASDLPITWSNPGTFMLAPLIRGDVDADSFASIASAATRAGIITQGLQRELDADQVVHIAPPPDLSLVRTCSPSYTFFRSTREAEAWTDQQVQTVLRRGARIVTTRGVDGATVQRENVTIEVDAFPAKQEVDTTGAGDVFATALILALDEGEQAATQIAAAFAAASVEHTGPAPLPGLSEIKQRLSAGQTTDHRRGARA